MAESQRNYSRLQDVWKMVSRTAYEQLNYSLVLLTISIFGMIIIYLLPFINLIYQNNNDLLLINLISILLMNISFLPTAKFAT